MLFIRFIRESTGTVVSLPSRGSQQADMDMALAFIAQNPDFELDNRYWSADELRQEGLEV